MGSRTIAHRFYVMDTGAIDFVLGADFFVQHSQIQSLTLQAPYLLYVDHGNGRESVPLEQSEHTLSYLRLSKEEPSNMMAASKTEDYQLLDHSGNVSPHRVQANHLVGGLTNTLGSLRSRPMPTPAAIPRSPFVPRTAQPPYSHVTNSTRAEPDRLGLTALRAMVDVEPYGSSDLGGDPSDDEPPSMTSASPSEDDDPEDPES